VNLSKEINTNSIVVVYVYINIYLVRSDILLLLYKQYDLTNLYACCTELVVALLTNPLIFPVVSSN
jgi:hypothetical protein